MPCGPLLLGAFAPFLASVLKALLPGTCLASSLHSGLDYELHPQRYIPHHSSAAAVPSSLSPFILLYFPSQPSLPLDTRVRTVYLLPLSRTYVCEGGVFALLTVGTPGLEGHREGSGGSVCIS